MRVWFADLALMGTPAAVAAQDNAPDITVAERLSGEEIESTLAGVRWDGQYRRTFDYLSAPDFEELIAEDGTLSYTDSGFTDAFGRWAVIGDTICFNYREPAIGGPHCFAVFLSGNCYVSVPTDGFYQNEYLARDWHAVMVKKGERFNCAPSVV